MMAMDAEPKLKVAVMGAGAVGGLLGGLLARAGVPVTLIVRGEHLRAIQERGLRVRGPVGDFTVRVPATDDTGQIDPVDLILFAVKTYQNREVLPLVEPLMDGGTSVLTLQNGAGTWEELQAALGAGRVLPAAMYVESKIEAPGVVRQQGNVYRVVFGEPGGAMTPRAQAIEAMLNSAGMPAEASTEILKVLWTKWLFIVTLAGLTGASRAPMAELLKVGASRDLAVRVMGEVDAVGRERGIDLDAGVVEETISYMDAEADSLEASMYTDLEKGRPLELEALNGAVSRLGRELGVATPANDALYALLKVHDLKGRGELP